jgi:hypothetical protein
MVYMPGNLDPIHAEARAIYERVVKPQLEPAHDGELVVINLDTSEFEYGPDDVEVSRRARDRFPGARLATMRVGRKAAFRIGGVVRRPAC